MSFIYYLLFFYIVGIILFFTKKYDVFTISLVFVIAAIYLYFGKFMMFSFLMFSSVLVEGIALFIKHKHGKRTYVNLLGNFLIGTVLVVFGQIYASAATISAAISDTFSSEIGRFSKTKPKLITNLKTVEHGTNGGVTLLGLFSALLASGISFCFFYFLFRVDIVISLIISALGFLGTLVDSVIGATLENKGYLDNCQTNFLTTLVIGGLGVLIFFLI